MSLFDVYQGKANLLAMAFGMTTPTPVMNSYAETAMTRLELAGLTPRASRPISAPTYSSLPEVETRLPSMQQILQRHDTEMRALRRKYGV